MKKHETLRKMENLMEKNGKGRDNIRTVSDPAACTNISVVPSLLKLNNRGRLECALV